MAVKRAGEGGSNLPSKAKVGHLGDHEVMRLSGAELGINVKVSPNKAKESHRGSVNPETGEAEKTQDVIGRVFRF